MRLLTIDKISFNLDELKSIELDVNTIYISFKNCIFKRLFESPTDAETTYDKLKSSILSEYPSEIMLEQFYS